MKNRNNEIEISPEMEFDYDDWEEEAIRYKIPAVVCVNPYEDYDIWDVEITETTVKKIAVFAKDAESAQKYAETLLDKIEMNDIDEYKKTATVKDNDGSSVAEYTVPLWWYEEDELDD